MLSRIIVPPMLKFLHHAGNLVIRNFKEKRHYKHTLLVPLFPVSEVRVSAPRRSRCTTASLLTAAHSERNVVVHVAVAGAGRAPHGAVLR